MSKQSGFMQRLQRAADFREAEARHYGRVFQMDLVTIALGRMGWRQKKFEAFDKMLSEVANEYCRGILDDAKGDKEVWYSKELLDREIKQYVGVRFIPYEERYR